MNLKYTISSLQGKRSSMQDTFAVVENLNSYFYAGVFDGHGGSNSAKLASIKLHKLISNNLDNSVKPLEAIKQAFLDLNDEIHLLKYDDGTTASVVLINDKDLYIAHVGDSRIIIKDNEGIKQLTKDHKITDLEELARYRSSNWFKTTSKLISTGKIKKFSLIAVSRSLGDLSFEDAISATPDIDNFKLKGNEKIIIASDGLWNVVNNNEVMILIDNNNFKNLEEETNFLSNEAIRRGSTDNITVIVITL